MLKWGKEIFQQIWTMQNVVSCVVARSGAEPSVSIQGAPRAWKSSGYPVAASKGFADEESGSIVMRLFLRNIEWHLESATAFRKC